MTISKNGQTIGTLEQWRQFGGPKAKNHWVEGRSAMEAARAWLDAAVAGPLPQEVTKALAGHPDFGSVTEWTAEPEARLPFDRRRGEPRDTDLLVLASDLRGAITIAVEAKADEPFGETITAAWEAAQQRLTKNPRSGGVDRLRDLSRALLGAELEQDRAIGGLRYQLLTATAGLVAEARRRDTSRALLLVHEFRTARTADAKQAANGRELNAFVHRLTSGAITEVALGQIVGPIALRQDKLWEAPPAAVYVGKVRRDLLVAGA